MGDDNQPNTEWRKFYSIGDSVKKKGKEEKSWDIVKD